LGQAIQEQRKAAGLTQEQLGEKAELHPNYIGEIERGEKAVSIDSLLKIAHALKVRAFELMRDL
jgi:transcriptional regulator with XRE-family HTH domain